MSQVAKIRGWLLQKPKPIRVRVVSVDGDTEELKVNRSYSKLAETIDALDCERVECLDADGKLLRALRLGADESPREDVPALPTVLAMDSNAAMLTHFAGLLHSAYKHSTEIAFTKLVEVMERLGSHSDSIEARLERTESQLRRAVNDQVDAEFDRAEELAEQAKAGQNNGDMGDQLLNSFLSGKLAGNANARPNVG